MRTFIENLTNGREPEKVMISYVDPLFGDYKVFDDLERVKDYIQEDNIPVLLVYGDNGVLVYIMFNLEEGVFLVMPSCLVESNAFKPDGMFNVIKDRYYFHKEESPFKISKRKISETI